MSREHFKKIMQHKSDHPGFWIGAPILPMQRKIYKHFGLPVTDSDDLMTQYADAGQLRLRLAKMLDESFVLLYADYNFGQFVPEEGKDPWLSFLTVDQGVIDYCETEQEIIDYPRWPDPQKSVNLEMCKSTYEAVQNMDIAVTGGCWCPFYHVVQQYFGIENYFCKIYTDPELVIAATEKITDMFLEANKRVFDHCANSIDAFFMGNDFGTQKDLFMSPETWRQFVKPYVKKLTDQAHSYGIPVFQHSCGSIYRIIPDLIECGIDGLNPLQPKASGMSAEELAQYKDDLVLIGGIDTQGLLNFGTPDEVKKEVQRVYRYYGDNWIVSPGHEAYEDDQKAENIAAMIEAAKNL